MVDAVANLCLETLRDLLVEEAKFLLSVGGDVEKVKRELKGIHGLLMKADKDDRSDQSPTLKVYLTELNALAMKAENVLETYEVEVPSRRTLKEKLQRYICIISECFSVHEVGNDVQDILSRLADLTKKLNSEFGQKGSLPSSLEVDDHRQTYAHYEDAEHVVGMEDDIGLLVSMVKDETRTQRVILIYGMGGLGKTTLARKIYNHKEMDRPYYARAWVCVTQHFRGEVVLGKILKQLDDNAQTDKMEVDDLVKGIYGFLEHRKGVIVVDDIWENYHWDVIKKAFPKHCNVLLTARSQKIAHPKCHLHKLDFLTPDQGWDLLSKIALPQHFHVQDERVLERIGREIVSKCGGLPLSISVMGGILSQKEESLAEWKKVNEQIDSYLRHGGEGAEEYKRVNQVLDLSYNALPYYLKPCFLYLASFSEDERIDPEKLYFLWMAEGFISHHDKQPQETLIDVAERYLTELALRCMVQAHRPEAYSARHRKFASCQLHDLMHDLCSSKAAEKILLERTEISRYQNDMTHYSVDTSTVRLSLDNPTSCRLAIIVDGYTNVLKIQGLAELKDLRSLMLGRRSSNHFQRLKLEDGTVSFERSKNLRIVVFDSCDFEDKKLPSKVEKLIHLRYLNLNYSGVNVLPEFVCSMPYLQTLDLRVLGGITLPNVIWKMKRLKHLFLPSYIEVVGGDKLRLDGLDELETLEEIDSENACIEDLIKLTRLRKLHVVVSDLDSLSTLVDHTRRSCATFLHADDCDLSSETGMNVLESVLMSGWLDTFWIWTCNTGGGFPCFREGMCENLKALRIVDAKFDGDVMRELGMYPMLMSLELEKAEFGKTILVCRSNSFPQLKSLKLSGLPGLRTWQVEQRAMPKLANLSINDCPNLEKVPEGLRFVSTLRSLDISKMPKEFKDRIRGQDCAIVSHIPSINLGD